MSTHLVVRKDKLIVRRIPLVRPAIGFSLAFALAHRHVYEGPFSWPVPQAEFGVICAIACTMLTLLVCPVGRYVWNRQGTSLRWWTVGWFGWRSGKLSWSDLNKLSVDSSIGRIRLHCETKNLIPSPTIPLGVGLLGADRDHAIHTANRIAEFTGLSVAGKNVNAPLPRNDRLSLRRFLTAFTIACGAFPVLRMFDWGPAASSIVVACCFLAILSLAFAPDSRCRMWAVGLVMFVPFVWAIRVSVPWGRVSGLIEVLVIGPSAWLEFLGIRPWHDEWAAWVPALTVVGELLLLTAIARRSLWRTIALIIPLFFWTCGLSFICYLMTRA